MKDKAWKERLGVTYSTNPDFKYDGEDSEEETLPKKAVASCVEIDKRNRAGKTVTPVSGSRGFVR